jgi:hypothetical protein
MNAPHRVIFAKLAKEIREETAKQDAKFRSDRQHFIENELVEFRPDFLEATEILSALKTGLALKVGPYGDDLPIEVEHAFQDLVRAMDAATPYEPEAFDSVSDMDRYEENGAPYGK